MSSELLRKLYATADDQQRWLPVLDDLRTWLGAGAAIVQMLDEKPDRLETVWQARDSRSVANAQIHDKDLNNPDNPRLQKPMISGLPAPAIAEMMKLGSDRRLFGRDPLGLADMRARLAKVGLGHAFWLSFPIGAGRWFSLIMHRKEGDYADLNEAEEAALRTLIPHMQQATQLWLSRQHDANRTKVLESAFDCLDLAVVMCDADLWVQWSNAAAEALIGRSRALLTANGRLRAGDAKSDARLRQMVRMAMSGSPESQVCLLGADEREQIHVRATKSSGNPFLQQGDGVALFLSCTEQQGRLEPADLCTLFALTPAEARLAAALAGGSTLASYSQARGIALGTARNQLKQVLSKTSSRSQPDLVRTLCNSAASRAR